MVINKFDSQTRREFERQLKDPRRIISMDTVQAFLKRRYMEFLAHLVYENQDCHRSKIKNAN